MKIGIVGLGFVGLVTAAILAEQGHTVTGIDVDKGKISSLRKGDSVIFEPDLDTVIARNNDRLRFSDSYENIRDSNGIFVCVATPDFSGRINLDYVFSAMHSLKDVGVSAPIAIKSTVVPGTARKIAREVGISVVSNPEFLREGSAVHDTQHPDRVVVGGADEDKSGFFADIWSFTNAPIIRTTNENAELIKYASNAFLATKISFINEIANLCEIIPTADVKVVAQGMGYDKRIAPFFLQAGLGFGGSCFPKDTNAIASFARDHGVKLNIIESTMLVNKERVEATTRRIEEKFGALKGKKICVLGLAFKDNTSDVRESKSWELIKKLQERGAEVKAFDPIVQSIADVHTTRTEAECIDGSDICIVATEWKQFDSVLTGEGANVIDLRGVLGSGKASLTVGKYAEN